MKQAVSFAPGVEDDQFVRKLIKTCTHLAVYLILRTPERFEVIHSNNC